MSPTVRIWWDNDLGAYRMVTPYNKGFLDLFKAAFPGSDRSWNADTKTWSFTKQHLPLVEQLVAKIFGSKPTVITEQQAQQASVPPSVSVSPLDKVMLTFFKLLPYEAARKAYLVGSQTLHPDKGGDMEKMTAFNSAWARIEKEVYGK